MKARLISRTLYVGLIVGFAVGVAVSIHVVASNRFIQYGMFRLAAVNFRESVNESIIIFVAISILLSILSFLVCSMRKLVRKSLVAERIEDDSHIEDEVHIPKLHMTLLVCSMFFFCGGWAVNHYWLPGRFHPVSLLADLGILGVAVLLGWVLLRAPWACMFKVLRTAALVSAVFSVILNLCLIVDGRTNRPEGPNVILIVVDTLRADHLSCHGYHRNTSPTIDELAGTGVFFKNAISTAPWTTPSVASMFTAQYPYAVGIGEEPVVLGNEFLTLSEVFKQNNYSTKGIISHVLVSRTLGFHQGFDAYDEENAQGHSHVSSPSITAKAISYIRKHKGHKFFLFLHYFDPHHSYILHEGYDYYPDYDGQLNSGQVVEELRKAAPSMSTDDTSYIRALYDSEISFTDEHIGMLLDRLKALGLYRDTLVVLTADHGEEFLERGDYWIGHTKKLYQELIHVPLIIKLPGDNKYVTVSDYVSLIDLMPTIVGCAGLSTPDSYHCQGNPMNLKYPELMDNRPVVSETRRWANIRSLIREGWKLLYDVNRDYPKLYNLESDPDETSDVKTANEDRLANMVESLRKWRKYVEHGKTGTSKRQPDFTEEQIDRLRSLGYVD